ncbi:hypothetical protein AB0N05_22040 [Nocardia sp. NPDC051030]|uniref:DUF7373 family lipoprotein n=1 Tax=Nocardia sp. NPDC051030 TaxID=3155162 RepID=UPI0034297BA9
MNNIRTRRMAFRKKLRPLIAAVAAAGAMATVTGCGISGSPAASEADIRKLDVGSYPTDPLDLRTFYEHSTLGGRALAIGRLAGATANGIDIDPKLKYGLRTRTIISSSYAVDVLAHGIEPILDTNGMMFGFSATSSTHPVLDSNWVDIPSTINAFNGETPDPAADSVNITVLQFPDEQRAQQAAEQIEAADFAVAPDENVAVPLAKYPSARSHWRPGVPSLGSAVAHGAYVINVYVQQPTPDLAGLQAFAERVYGAQIPLLDQLPPMNPRELLLQDYDPDLMMQRTLHPNTVIGPKAGNELVHTPRAFLHFMSDQSVWKKLIDDGGVDRISLAAKGALLLRARDARAATSLWSSFKAPEDKPADQPAGVPDVFCTENPNPKSVDFSDAWNNNDRFYCTIRYGRYVARVAGAQLKDVNQRAAAQYALLAKSQYL